MNRPGFTETFRFISRDHFENVALCIEVLFGLCWRDVSDGAKQPPVVEPIDPAEGGHFQILHIKNRVPRSPNLGPEAIGSWTEDLVPWTVVLATRPSLINRKHVIL